MTPDGFGRWPGAAEVARVGGPVRPHGDKANRAGGEADD